MRFPGFVFRLVTYLPRRFSRGDERISERRASGYTTISVTKDTRTALELLCRDVEETAREMFPEFKFAHVSMEYLLASLTLGHRQVWEHKDRLPDEFTSGLSDYRSSVAPAEDPTRPVARDGDRRIPPRSKAATGDRGGAARDPAPRHDAGDSDRRP